MAINATFGNPSVNGNEIRIPFTLPNEVFSIVAGDFEIATITDNFPLDDAIAVVSHDVYVDPTQARNKYTIILDVPDDRKGSVKITPYGNVLKLDATKDNITGNPIAFPVDTIVPDPVYFVNPANIVDGDPFWFIVGFNVPVISVAISDFEFSGISGGDPALYRSSYFGAASGLVPFDTAHNSWILDTSTETTHAAQYFALYFSNTGDVSFNSSGIFNVYIDGASVYGLGGADTLPHIENIPDQTLTQNTAYSKVVPVSTATTSSLHASSGLPAGVTASITGDVLTIAGTPTTVGSGTGSIQIQNTTGTKTFTFDWEVEAQAGGGGGAVGGSLQPPRGQATPTITFSDKTLYRGETFSVTGTVTGADNNDIKVEGLLLGWTYTLSGSAGNQTITVSGTAPDRVLTGIWTITATMGTDTATATATYRVQSRTPTITAITAPQLVQNRQELVEIPFTNRPTAASVESELIGMEFRINITDNKLEIYGTPDKLISAGIFKIQIGNDGGEVSLNQAYSVVAAAIFYITGNGDRLTGNGDYLIE